MVELYASPIWSQILEAWHHCEFNQLRQIKSIKETCFPINTFCTSLFSKYENDSVKKADQPSRQLDVQS